MDERKTWTWLVAAFVAACLGIGAVVFGALMPDDYRVGTPAKARVDHCDYLGRPDLDSSPDMYCTGTWNLGGQPQTGPIRPPLRGSDQKDVRPGKSVLDVHVHNGAAYTATSEGKYLYPSLVIGAVLLLLSSSWLWRIWARRRSATT